jgi:hypothetical protein
VRAPGSVAERVYGLLLWLYPPSFRREYGAEMRAAFRDWKATRQDTGEAGRRKNAGQARGAVGFWIQVVADLLRSVPRAWWEALRERGCSTEPHAPPYTAAALAGLAVYTLYWVTLAPTIAFWDSGEYVTVAHTLGIPHPPGNPLFVLLAKGWETLLAPFGLSVAVRVNLFSAALSAAAHGLWFLVADRSLAGWTDDRRLRLIAASAAVLVSATAFTVWSQSNVNEKVYTVSLFTTALAVWLALRWRDRGMGDTRLLALAFLLALTATNHLMGILVAPALLVFVLWVDPRPILRPRFWARAVPLAALAMAVLFFLPIRAAQQPLVNQGAPECETAIGAAAAVYTWGAVGCDALSAVLRREQYPERRILADPTDLSLPRAPGLVAAQFLNWFQYFDWQWARSVKGHDPLLGGARPLVTLLFLVLGLIGARAHWRGDRKGAGLMAVLFLTFSAGLVIYLNFRYGYTIAWDRFPAVDMHEVRERDYFFLLGFSVWGLWAGMGVVAAWRDAARWLNERRPLPGLPPRFLAAPILCLALIPLALNWGWASRAGDYTARDWAYNVLMSVEPYGVLVTNGDNDSFPLWYLQKVERIREDVTIVLSPYLNLAWYAGQIRDLTRPCPPGVDPAHHPDRIVCQRPFQPDLLPAPLRRLGWAHGVKPPQDSILELTDDQIAQIARGFVVTSRPVTLAAGELRTTIPAGTPLSPADSFAAAIIQSTHGQRPIHFMPGSSHIRTLNLVGHTVRHGLTWRIDPVGPAGGRIVPLPDPGMVSALGAAVDVPATDTLLHDVFIRRGRILKGRPWVDHATTSIPYQYVSAHYASAQAHMVVGNEAEAHRHVRRGMWWQGVVGAGVVEPGV